MVVVVVVVGQPTLQSSQGLLPFIQPLGQHFVGPRLLDAPKSLGTSEESLVLPSGSLGRAFPGTPEP